MKSNKRIIAFTMAVAITLIAATNGFAADRVNGGAMGFSDSVDKGYATIGFSIDSGDITYNPLGISSVSSNLSFDFGVHAIGSSSVQTFTASNKAGYVVNNKSAGTAGYTVTLGLSSFDNGLQGASLTLSTDNQGVVSDISWAKNPPVLFGGNRTVTLEADGLSSVVVLEGKRYAEDPSHVALGNWGANFIGELKVYSHTIRPGFSRAVMTWELTIA